jgi:hypothetical protein
MTSAALLAAALALAPSPAAPAAESPAPDPAGEASTPATHGATVVDRVLPCGLRIITAQDQTLPVAAIVLAIEVGTADDPENLPGLVHALAYHLQLGTRELGPGEAVATAHDAGGLATMAVGPHQVRFESLVPITALDRVLRVESLRLRAPNVRAELWRKALGFASADPRPRGAAPGIVAAAAWAEPGLDHEGRRVDRVLRELPEGAVAARLSRHFGYHRATLVVVSPDDPEATFERAAARFADLPAHVREVADPRAALPEPRVEGPREILTGRGRSSMLALPVVPTPAARLRAATLCDVLGRRPREDGTKRLRCAAYDDPRRPLLLLRAQGVDEVELARTRIAQVLAGEEYAVAWAQRAARLASALESPLELAVWLSGAAVGAGDGTAPISLAEATGIASGATTGDAGDPVAVDRGALLLAGPEQPSPAAAPADVPARSPGSDEPVGDAPP